MEEIICPICGEPMTMFANLQHIRVSRYENCARKCLHCAIGASNDAQHPTFIYQNYQRNVPACVREHLEYTMANSLNVLNRNNKRRKFAFCTSEDALTWLFIRSFIVDNTIQALADTFGLTLPMTEILIWGVPQISPIEDAIVPVLKKTLDALGELGNSRSEPDVILVSNAEIVFIEVKLSAQNALLFDANRFQRYVTPAPVNHYYANTQETINTGLYELTRNWTIGNCLAERLGHRGFKLYNLGPQGLFDNNNVASLNQFRASLNNRQNFITIAWEDVVENVRCRQLKEAINHKLNRHI